MSKAPWRPKDGRLSALTGLLRRPRSGVRSWRTAHSTVACAGIRGCSPEPRASLLRGAPYIGLNVIESVGGYRFGAAICFVVGIAILVWSFVSRASDSKLATVGIRTTGVVQLARIDDTLTSGRDRSVNRQYLLEIEYVAKQKRVRREFDVQEDYYWTHQFGTPVAVIYDPQDANNSQIAENFGSATSGAMIFGSIMIVIGIGLLIYASIVIRQASEKVDPDLDEALRRARDS